MSELLTSARMRAVEAAAIDSGAVTGLELMERAGRGVVEAVFAEWPGLAAAPHRAVVLCGPGNNGGDGFVVARLLKGWGWEVEVFLLGRLDRLPPDAAVNATRWAEAGGRVRTMQQARRQDLSDVALIVDAVFGLGLSRPIPADVSCVFEGKARLRVVAIDVPSGLCAESGRFLRESREYTALAACLTVTFHAVKAGHVLADGPGLCGKVVVADIGLGPSRAGVEHDLSLARPDIEALSKGNAGHKYTHGHALILSGGPGHGGAGRLAARGALRIGAGLVTLGCQPDALTENAAQLNAVMLRAIGDADALTRTLEDNRINALCLGPGLGVERARDLVPAALASGTALVLDADVLSAFAAAPEMLFKPLGSHRRCVLTPHAGEFARLFPDIAEKLNASPTRGPAYSKIDATREAAVRAGCVILFKGADTVIAAPEGRCRVNAAVCDRAAPWLATAGSGDVLAGFVAGLLARGLAPMQAAETAAWLHVECARSFGPGLIAEDLPEELPKVFRGLGL